MELVRKAGKGSAAGFVNALLRRVSRERSRLPLPLPPPAASDRAAALDYLETTLSHPRWLAARWMDRYGYDATVSWLTFNNRPAPLTIRANTLRIARNALAVRLRDAGVETGPTSFAIDGLIVRSGNPLLTPLAREGLFVVQDEASQLVGVVCRRHAWRASSSTRAHRPAARPRKWLPRWGTRDGSSRPTFAAGVSSCWRELSRTRPLGASRSFGQTRARLCRSWTVCSMRSWSTHRVPGLGTIRRDPDIRWRRTGGRASGACRASAST